MNERGSETLVNQIGRKNGLARETEKVKVTHKGVLIYDKGGWHYRYRDVRYRGGHTYVYIRLKMNRGESNYYSVQAYFILTTKIEYNSDIFTMSSQSL